VAITYPSLANDDILLYTIVGRLNAQTILTTFHYKVVGSAGGEGYVETLSRFLAYSYAGDGVLTNYLTLMPTNYTCDIHKVQRIYPSRLRYVAGLVEADGTSLGVSNNQNIALSVKRIGLAATRQGVGRVQLPVADSAISEGIINLSTLTAVLASFEEACLAEFTPTDSPVAFQPVLFGKDANGTYRNTPLIQMQAYPESRPMHRRTVGLGI